MTLAGRLLTERDADLLRTLTQRVRVLSVAQASREWWGGQRRALESGSRRLTILERLGMVSLYSAFAHPEIPLTAPVLVWRPGEPDPEFGSASYHLRTRWSEPVRMTPVVIATRFAASQFGGWGGRTPRSSELSHDLHLAAVFLKLRRDEPGRAATWASEASQYAAGGGRKERLPDAIVGRGKHRTAIEFGGAYSKSKLTAFHEHCEARDLPYEVW